MKYIITESQVKKMYPIIQKLIDSALNEIREESEEWGLGAMDELNELESIGKIVIDRIVNVTKPKVYVKIFRNTNREDFDNIRAEIQYRVDKWFPNIEIYIAEIIDERTFGPGIDW